MLLCLDFSPTKQKKGGFKLATFGTASQDLFGAGRFNVCAKQTFYQKTVKIEHAGQDPVEITQNIPHDGATQVRNLTMEITCLVWARVLLNLVYKFINKHIGSHGAPPFQIPCMHFVEAWLAVEHVTSENGNAGAFFLEEVIGDDEGHFRKYINNVSTAPMQLLTKMTRSKQNFWHSHSMFSTLKQRNWHLLLIIKVCQIVTDLKGSAFKQLFCQVEIQS